MKRAECKPVWMILALLLHSPLSTIQGQPDRCSDLVFEHTETLSNHQGLWNIAVGDLDGDGDLDLVSVGIYKGGIFSVFYNRGDGSFETPTFYTVGDDPRCILLEDLDGDSDLDLIVSNSLGGKLFVYTNPGNGAFGLPSAEYEFPEGVRPVFFVSGDLDDDGDLDLAISDAYGSIPVLWNRGDGIFDFGPSYEINRHGFLYEIVAQDLNGDGFLDLAVLVIPFVAPYVLPDNDEAKVFTLTNDGSGGFGGLQGYDTPSWPTVALAAADLDGDGDVDLAGVNSPNANPDPNGMWLLFNDGLGHFGDPTVYPVGPWPFDVNFGDLDGDGDLDAVVPNHRFSNAPPPHDVSILLNRGDGTFEDERREIVGYKPIAAVPVDLDDDMDLDIAVANFAGYGHPSSISVLSNFCDHCCCLQRCCFTSGICFPPGSLTPDECIELAGVLECAIEPCRIGCLIGDSDGDGDLDLGDKHNLQNCYSGLAESAAYVRPTTECLLWFDFDLDLDVDLDDYRRFFEAYLGPQGP